MSNFQRPSKKDYFAIVVNGAFITMGLAFYDVNVVMSSYIYTLTQSNFLVGLGSFIQDFGSLVPQWFAAHLIEHKERKKPTYQYSAFVRVAAWIGLFLSILFLGGGYKIPLFILSIFFFAMYCFASGFGVVPFLDVACKVFPVGVRGRIFGIRRALGGGLAIAAAVVTGFLLSKYSGLSFPFNYGVVFLCAGIAIAISAFSFFLIREPLRETRNKNRKRLKQHVRDGKNLFLSDPYFKKILIARILLIFSVIGFPFLVVYGKENINMVDSDIWLFITIQVVTTIVMSIVWGYVSDKFGNRIILLLTAFASIFAPLIALTVNFIPQIQFGEAPFLPGTSPITSQLLYLSLSYIIVGIVISGNLIGIQNFILEVAPESVRPTYIGTINLILAPITFARPLAGFLASVTSLDFMFFVSFAFAVTTTVYTIFIKEPRKQPSGK